MQLASLLVLGSRHKSVPCKFAKSGVCRFGSSCVFQHGVADRHGAVLAGARLTSRRSRGRSTLHARWCVVRRYTRAFG